MNKPVLLISGTAVLSALAFLWFLSSKNPRPTEPPPRPSLPAQQPATQQPANKEAPTKSPAQDSAKLAEKLKATFLGRAEIDPAQLWDPTADLKTRRRIAWHLARSSNPIDFKTVTDYLSSPDGDPRVKALILESLGESPHPEARTWILAALDTGDEAMILSALRGLAGLDHPGDEARFADLLNSPTASAALCAEAALALGALSSLNSEKILISAYQTAPAEDDELREMILTGLGQRNIAETQAFFQSLLDQEPDPERRLEIVSAVSDAPGDAAPFLIQQLSDSDSNVRAEAVWALSMQEADLNEILCDQLEAETNSEVRQRLYEALDEQENPDLPLILKHSLKEENINTQLAAFSLIATRLDEIENPTERESAEFVLANELEQMAVDGTTLNQRMRAVIGLQRMNTAQAEDALKRVISNSTDPRVIHATRTDLQELIDSE